MSSTDQSGSSSPDPLAISQNGSHSPRAKDGKSSTSRKALRLTTGNASTHEIFMAAPSLQRTRDCSPDKSQENEASPWRIRVTVQAEQEKRSNKGAVAQCSPSKVFAEKTFTTTVPLKTGDEPSPARRKQKGTHRKQRYSSRSARSTSKSPRSAVFKSDTESPTRQTRTGSSSTPKRGRGRPRKSIDPSTAAHWSCKTTRTSNNLHSPLPRNNDTGRNHRKGSKYRLENPGYEKSHSMRPSDEYGDFDSVMESEGFSMVSVSSLSSAQSISSNPAESGRRENNASPSVFERHKTPSVSHASLIPPSPPKPAVPLQVDREVNKPTGGTPRLARVVRAGIALQGVLSPANQRSGLRPPSLREHSSPPLLYAASPRDRMDDLFSGFGPGTRRELRAGLRLGEELAKRQSLESRPHFRHEQANENIFANDLDIGYPKLPGTSPANGYSLKIPGAARKVSPSFSNTQLPSPARSEVNDDDDQMSWKFDTIPQRAAAFHCGTSKLGNINREVSPIMDRTMMERQAEWQRERDIISNQIQEANPSQIIVIDSDDEEDRSSDPVDDGDIWQKEAQNSHNTDQSPSDVPPIFRQFEPPKPRRSQLPSPWMRKSQDVLESTNDSDLFWQPNQTEAVRKTSETPIERKPFNHESSSLESPGVGYDSPLAEIHNHVRNTIRASNEGKGSAAQEPQLSAPAHKGNQEAELMSHPQPVTLPYEEPAQKDPANLGDEDLESEKSITDGEDLDAHLLSQHSMQEGMTCPLDEGTELDRDDSLSSTTGGFEEDVPEPQTPLALTTLSKSKTPKHVRFSTEKPRLHATAEVPAAHNSAPLPPAPTSWFSRVTSLLPRWGATAPAAVPLPTCPKRKIVLSKVDQGPLPMYMPWTQSHWWALIHIVRQSQADPSTFPYTSTMACANYLGHVVSVNKWSKKITKQDCAVLQQFVNVLGERGVVQGVEAMLLKGGKKQWGKAPGELIGMGVILSAVVSQWACDVQDGICTIGWSDRAGVKAGYEEEVWTKADLPVDGPRVVYVV
ncbi:MAG: hypothetical protein LQ338_005190 [Usnochroma carphineum]|nr:MAG: hypothetical protein LQ338_005190 [Usnochroma carphineum]